MNYNQFSNLSCYEEFEIQCALTGISKVNVLKEFGHKIDDYYFFVSGDGVFNWYDLEGNIVEDPGVLKEIEDVYIPKNIIKCIIPDGITRIGLWAFNGCKSLKEIIIPDSVTNIDDNAFSHCISLKEITIPNSVTGIGKYAFTWCESLKEITIPDSVKHISKYAFFNCGSLKEIIIPNSVTGVGDYAFVYCISLKEITIPNSVTSIGRSIFEYCSSLKQVIFKGRSLDEVKQMENYHFGIEDERIIKCEYVI